MSHQQLQEAAKFLWGNQIVESWPGFMSDSNVNFMVNSLGFQAVSYIIVFLDVLRIQLCD